MPASHRPPQLSSHSPPPKRTGSLPAWWNDWRLHAGSAVVFLLIALAVMANIKFGEPQRRAATPASPAQGARPDGGFKTRADLQREPVTLPAADAGFGDLRRAEEK